MVSKLLLLASLSLGSFQAVYGSGCHGASGFRLAPAHPKSAPQDTASSSSSSSSSSTKSAAMEEKQIVMAASVQQNAYCESEYGEGSKVLDLAQMKEEFKNKPDDLQHALLPLFEEDPQALYLVSGDGHNNVLNQNQKLVLALEEADTPNSFSGSGKKYRVAGPVFVETRDADFLQEDETVVHTSVLCFIPKPKYDPDDTNMSGMTMSMDESSTDQDSSSSSWGMSSWFGMITLAALCVAAVQTWKARQASGNSFPQHASLDLGGSYSVLASDGSNSLLSSNVEMP